MILSMTGFGEAQLEEDGHAYHVEIRSVNNRYFKASIRLPEDLAFLESEAERLLRQKLTRGSVTLRVYIRDLSAEAAADLNQAALQRYITQLRAAAPQQPGLLIDLATLASLPGVCQARELSEEQRERGWAIIEKLTVAALDKLVAMRSAEGRALAEDLRAHLSRVRRHLDSIRGRAPLVVAEYRTRLESRINELIADRNIRLAEEDLIKEVAIYAERSDVSEEISRLSGHLDQFAAAMDGPEPAGRKLDFISQELLREANTIGSKAGDAQIARDIIDIKSAIDRIKEQVQNAE